MEKSSSNRLDFPLKGSTYFTYESIKVLVIIGLIFPPYSFTRHFLVGEGRWEILQPLEVMLQLQSPTSWALSLKMNKLYILFCSRNYAY